MDIGEVALHVRGVCVEGPDDAPLVILEDGRGARRLSIPVGPFEASAIIMELEGITPPRPLTHDLLASFFKEAGYALDRVVLFGTAPNCPRARLLYRRGFRRLEREIRPSDALALALRLCAPVIADPELIHQGNCPDIESTGGPHPRVLLLDDWKTRSIRP